MWVRYWARSSRGGSESVAFEYWGEKDSSDEQIKDSCEEWAQRPDICGGCEHYRYGWDRIANDALPFEIRMRKIAGYERSIANAQRMIALLKGEPLPDAPPTPEKATAWDRISDGDPPV
jgi:hypothetical protein